MPHIHRCISLAFGIACLATSTQLRAQSVDSLTSLLASTDILVRGDAVEALARVPVSAVPSATRDALIALLEREATETQARDPQLTSEEDEAWGEYIIGLADLECVSKRAW